MDILAESLSCPELDIVRSGRTVDAGAITVGEYSVVFTGEIMASDFHFKIIRVGPIKI